MDETSRDKELHERLITVPWMIWGMTCAQLVTVVSMEGQRCVYGMRVVGKGNGEKSAIMNCPNVSRSSLNPWPVLPTTCSKLTGPGM